MAGIGTIADLNKELYRQYLEAGDKNVEFEQSFLQTLVYSREYDLILTALNGGFDLNLKTRDQLSVTGDLGIYQFLYANKVFPLPIIGMTHAIINGRMDTILWLQSIGCPFAINSCEYAARNGHLEILQWLWKNLENFPIESNARVISNEIPLEQTGICNNAAMGGHLHILEWLREINCPWFRIRDLKVRASLWNEDTCNSAAMGGHLFLVKWLRKNGCSWDEWTFNNMAKHGQIEGLQWLRENGCPWSKWTCAYAALGGNLGALKWLRTNGCPWHEWTCIYAVDGDHLDILKYARGLENTSSNPKDICPWNEGTCSMAAATGNLEMLKWLREHGCPWDEVTYVKAYRGGYRDIVQWLRTQGLKSSI